MCKKECYARELLNGSLHMNSIGWFQDNVDELEGSIVFNPPVLRELRINNRVIHSARKLFLKPHQVRQLNAYCMYAMNTGPFDSINRNNLHELQEYLQISENCVRDFGEYAVMVHDVGEFIRRVDAAIGHYDQKHRALVKYYDPDSGSSNVSEDMEIPFFKPNRFSHEREYRIVVDARNKDESEIKMDIGPIHDIAKLYTSSSIRVNVSGDESTDTSKIDIKGKEI